MGIRSWWPVIVVLCLSCRVAPRVAPYPPARCADRACDGRVTTLGVLQRSWYGFQMLDLDPSPAHHGKLIRVSCDACPLKVGATYRARMTKDELIYSLLLDGSEIFYDGNSDPATTRPDHLALDHPMVQPECDLTTNHWELVDDWPTCTPGAKGPPMSWVSGDGLNPRVPGCSPNFPTGFIGYRAEGTVAISVQLSSSYTLADPELAHDVFPQVFVETLNDVYVSIGARAPEDPRFVLADGPPKLTALAVLQVDATGDHYGVSVSITTPENGENRDVLFYEVPPLYVTGLNLARAAARTAVGLLETPGGWSCEDGVTKPRYTLQEWCEDHREDSPEAAASWVCQTQ